jgi:hypothetical protein
MEQEMDLWRVPLRRCEVFARAEDRHSFPILLGKRLLL